ncbi:MAG: type II secretion system protein [Candidatus Gastranaerophilales bacterium]|nr:type II secretion system protein [Candidatus Gastranaerophilales bacterium]
MSKIQKRQKYAFTLAEVLITLVIIGVIAAMTIPSLLNNTNKQEYKTAFKKAVSSLNQAITLHYALDGETVNDFDSSSTLLAGLFEKRMNIISTTAGVSYASTKSDVVFYTADGISYGIKAQNPQGGCYDQNTDTPCFIVYVDVNGDKKPNSWSQTTDNIKDGYKIELFDQSAVPWGKVAKSIMYDGSETVSQAEEPF